MSRLTAIGRAAAAVEGSLCSLNNEADNAAADMAYDCLRVVILAQNHGMDLTKPYCSRLHKSEMTLTPTEVKGRLTSDWNRLCKALDAAMAKAAR